MGTALVALALFSSIADTVKDFLNTVLIMWHSLNLRVKSVIAIKNAFTTDVAMCFIRSCNNL